MDFAFDAKTNDIVDKVNAFMEAEVYPAEAVFAQQIEESIASDRWSFPPIVHEIRAKAKAQGLWNFFAPGAEGAGLTNLQYAPIAEITGRSIQIGPQAFNCAAPDTGNMEVLSMFGTDEQKKQWLEPLLEGTIRSAFAMTEPQVASSDATNIELSIVRDGDEYVIDGRKWWITGAMNPDCNIFIVMGKTDPNADRSAGDDVPVGLETVGKVDDLAVGSAKAGPDMAVALLRHHRRRRVVAAHLGAAVGGKVDVERDAEQRGPVTAAPVERFALRDGVPVVPQDGLDVAGHDHRFWASAQGLSPIYRGRPGA